MLLRALLSLLLVGVLQALVVWQIRLAARDGFLTVEQLAARNERALSFDRHYAMALDFTLIAPFSGLTVFLCAPQWDVLGGAKVLLLTLVAMAGLVWVWSGGHEAHARDGSVTGAGWVHALFATVAVWVIAMALTSTPRPEPVLLLAMCIVVPAFLFTGTHMFLGLVNFAGDATTFPGRPLADPVAWCVTLGGCALVWGYAFVRIPASFWHSLQ